LKKGIEPVADVVVNHRSGSGGWATFKDPDWPAKYICATDEFWFVDKDNPTLSAGDKEILAKGEKGAPDYRDSDYPNWHGARDLDHNNPDLRRDIKEYLTKLKGLGYRGWRYDMVKGFDPKCVAEYNFASQPAFAVGEYWDSNPDRLTQWIDQTKLQGQPDPALKACAAFDFATYELLKQFINNGKYNHLPAVAFKDGVYDGLIAVNKDKAVTFLENHDTGFPQKQFDSFPNNEKVLHGYAYILTHPGVPCVYWKHYFDWNHGGAIKAIIRARKYAGVHSGSYVKTEVHDNNYVAIVGDQPSESSTLIVKIGYGLGFKPDENVWGLETSGEGYAVWVRKTKKSETQAKVDGPKPPFPVE
jgi:alpha-amylase